MKKKASDLAHSIAVKAAFKRKDDYSLLVEKVEVIIQHFETFSKLAVSDLPSGNMVLIIQHDIENNFGILIEYGLIMFALQNMLDTDRISHYQKTIIKIIFNSVLDIRDHRYRFGRCLCLTCRG